MEENRISYDGVHFLTYIHYLFYNYLLLKKFFFLMLIIMTSFLFVIK